PSCARSLRPLRDGARDVQHRHGRHGGPNGVAGRLPRPRHPETAARARGPSPAATGSDACRPREALKREGEGGMEAVEKLETAKEEAALVRRAGPGDVAVVLELLREHYGEGHDVAARHEWLYRQNPH